MAHDDVTTGRPLLNSSHISERELASIVCSLHTDGLTGTGTI
jgi:hypothetical protein